MTVAKEPQSGGLPASDNLRGVLAMLAGMLAFTGNFAFVKLAGSALPVGEILFLRGLVAVVILSAAILATGVHRQIGLVLHPLVRWRTLCECLASVSFVTALMSLPIGTTTVILQAMPLAITAGAAFWLGETVHWRRWAAVLAGLAGVAIVIRPGLASFQWASLLVLVSVVLSAIRDLSTRRLPERIPSLLVAAAALATLSMMGLGLSVFETWSVPDFRDFAMVSGSAVCMSTGVLLVVFATRRGQISVIAPFRYSAVLWALLLGYLVWGETIDFATFAGAAIIIGSGAYITYRERMLRLPPRGSGRPGDGPG